MTSSPGPSSLGKTQRLILLLASLVFAGLLFILRGGITSQAPLDQLARRSLDPDTALVNGRPTIFEFYADWCEACREMAPAMLKIDIQNESKVDFVLLNVDNPMWEGLISKYEVTGIPQLNFFNTKGELIGRSIGVRTEPEIQQLVDALVQGVSLPKLVGVGATSGLDGSKFSDKDDLFKRDSISPMSHG